MAVVSVKTMHDGWSASFAGKGVPSFTVVYLVEVDSPQDGNLKVLAASGIPQIGSSYSVGTDQYPNATCKSLSTTPVSGTRNLWQITASFGAVEGGEDEEDPTDGTTQDGEPTEDPLQFAVSMSMSTSRVTRDAIVGTFIGVVTDGAFLQQGFDEGAVPPQFHGNVQTDASGKITNGRAITNSAFIPFDPPVQTEYNRTNVKIKFNTLNSPSRLIPYINSVNSKHLKINLSYRWDDEWGEGRASTASVDIPAYAGRLMGISTTPSRRNGIGFHENEIEIEIDKLYGWRLDVLDRGYATTNKEEMFGTGSEGKSYTKIDAVVTEDGFASREPILLDGMGQALDVKSSESVFIRYGVYPEKNWKEINLHQPKFLQGAD